MDRNFEVMVMEWVPIVLALFKGTILLIGMVYAIKWHYDQDRKLKEASGSFHSAMEMRFFTTMIIVPAIAVVSIAYAGCWGNPADGGWGGAMGCALTFIMCFMGKPAAPATTSEASAEPANLAEALAEVTRLKAEAASQAGLLAARMESTWREKIYLGVAGLVGALAWKFGAVAAAGLSFAT
jgi:hypothetical protein